MTVKLSQLRVSADMEAEGFVRGAQQVAQATAAISAAAKLTGRELAAIDAGAEKASSATKSLQRAFVDGYAASARFETAIKSLNSEMEKGNISNAAAAKVLQGMAGRYGEIGSGLDAYGRGLKTVAPLIEQVSSSQAKMAAMKVDFGNFTDGLKAQSAEQSRLLGLREKIVSTYLLEQHAQETNAKRLAEITEAERARIITSEQAVAARVAEQVRYDQEKRSIEVTAIYKNKYGASGNGLARHEAVNLSRQLQDVFVSLQGGQAPLTVLFQQGTQIADIFATSQASIGGFARSVASGIVSVKGMAVGLGLMGAAAIVAGYQFSEAQHEVQRNLNGLGRASGLTVDSINAIAEASKNLSRGEARDALGAFAATGRIGANAAGILDLVKGYSKQTGTDVSAAVKELAGLFADPLAGAEKLATSIGGIDAKTMDYIRTLKSKNDIDGAQRALMDAISPRLKEAAKNIGDLENWWGRATRAMKEYWDDLGKASAPLSTQDKLKAATEAQALRSLGPAGSRSRYEQQAIARGANEIAGLRNQSIMEQIQQANRVDQERDNRSSLAALAITDKFFPDQAERRSLMEDIATLEKFTKNPNADKLSQGYKDAAAALAQMKANQDALLTPVQRIQLATEISVKSIMARTVQERIIVERMQEQLALSQSGAKADEVRAQTAQRIAEIMAQANKDARDALRDSNERAATLGMSPFARAQKEAQFEYQRNLERFGTGGGIGGGGGASLGGRFNGLDQTFATSLDQFIKAAAAEGYKLSITSGYRSIEDQAKIYAEKGPGWAAPPGRSNHNFGQAADLGFGPGAQSWAHENAARFGLAFPLKDRANNPEAWHVEPVDARARRNGMPANDNAGAAAQIRANSMAAAYGPYLDMLRQAGVGIDAEKDALARLQKQSTATSFEMTKQAKVDEMMNTLRQQGVPITEEMKKKIDELASSYGNLGASMASAKMMQDAMFERSQIGRSSDDQAIASRLRGTGLSLNGPEAEALRMNQALSESKAITMDIGKTLIDGFRQGKNGAEILKSIMDKMLDRLANKALDSLVSNIFSGFGKSGPLDITGGGGGILSGIGKLFGFGSMNGNVFGPHGHIAAFAGGGAFTNGVVSRPTLFPMGLMGEAGEEAIMPLKRDGNGRLGVMAAANSNAPSQQVMHSVYAPVINVQGNADASAVGSIKRELAALGRRVEQRDMRDMRQRQGRGNY